MSMPARSEGFSLDPISWDAPLALSVPNGAARYSEFSPLGMGGKAEVYLCLDETLGRRVAYKVLRHELIGSVEDERRLVREARLMAKFTHPSIPEVYEIGRDAKGRPYFTMRVGAGVTLQWLLDALRCGDLAVRREFSLERRVHVVEQAARALGYAHACGVVHADLKPDNLLVEDCERTLLIDWGLAELADGCAPRSASQRRQGAPLHMPPEQIVGAGVIGDRRSDVYRLGSVLYECLALAPLTTGANVQEVLYNTVQRTPIPPRQKNPQGGVTRVLEEVCLRAVAKNPLARYPDANAFAGALREGLLDLLVHFERDVDVASPASNDDPAANVPSAAELDAWWDLRATDSH